MSGTINSSLVGQGNAGEIDIKANSLSLTSSATIASSTFGQGNAGNINLDIRDTINISGFQIVKSNGVNLPLFTAIDSTVIDTAEGNGGKITIKAGALILDDNGQINTLSIGKGNAGKISIEVKDKLKLNNLSVIRSTVQAGGIGNSGNIDIQTRSLTLTNGAQISAGIYREENGLTGGKGKGGNIRINATDFVDITGFYPVQLPIFDPLNPTKVLATEGFPSTISSNTERGATGVAGNIVITTNDFRIADGAAVASFTSNQSDAGSITIDANNFQSIGGGQIITTTRSGGNAGDIKLKIDNDITISGIDPTFTDRFEKVKRFGNPEDIIFNQGEKSGLFANSAPNATGEGGSISIDSEQATIANDATISVTSEGKGNGGSLFVNAKELSLDNQVSLKASAASGTGGNIGLKVEDLLEMDNNSQISAQAFGNANGGNINLDTQSIVAFPQKNNDIIANAKLGRGGNIDISAETIFGLVERSQNSITKDIDASSQTGIQGNVSINTPDINSSITIIKIPENIIEPNRFVTQSCINRSNTKQASSFAVVGRGGLPTDFTKPLTNDFIKIENQLQVENSKNVVTIVKNSDRVSADEIVPAQGMIVNDRGEVVFTRYPTTNNNQRNSSASIGCSTN